MRTPAVAIVGAGMSGICMAAKLKRDGIEDFVVLEKADRVGGTWRDNTYPGLSCDVPSRFYQFSFDLEPGWSHVYSPGEEIRRYLERAVERHGLGPHLRLATEAGSARFEDGGWTLRAGGEELRADFLVNACGVLHHPRFPDIAGLGDFAGAWFHSARWDHSVPLDGRRVGVVGTGSSAVQIVTAIAPRVASLDLYQRTPQWVLPLRNRRYTRATRAALRALPALDRAAYRGTQATFELFTRALIEPCWQRSLVSALCRLHLRRVRDRDLRRRLTPAYEPMCKRLVASWGFYDAVQRPNVELVTDPIERVEESGVRTADGHLRETDVLVLATGFDAHAYVRPMELVGAGGVTLEEAWKDGPRAYLTVALPGFPNHFMLIGPHSPFGNHSLMPIAEAQADYALAWIRRWRTGETAAVAPTQAATDRYNAELRAAMPRTIWASGCHSWYLGADGLPEVWPWTPARHRELLRAPRPADFENVGAPETVAA